MERKRVDKNLSFVINQPLPMRVQVYEYLRERILNHSILPSARLVEAQIAKEMGISRTPIREALHLLEKDGFIESIPRVGYQVKELAWDELEEIFEIRRVLETLACRWVIKRIDAQSLKALEDNMAETEAALKKGPPNIFLKYDEEFHEILVRAAASKHLLELHRQVRQFLLRYRAAGIRNMSSVRQAIDGHAAILACLKNKDEKGFEAAIVDHLIFSKEDIREFALNKNSETAK